MFEDEFGFSFCEPVATTWAPRGQTKGVGKYRREVSTMVGVTLSGKIYKRHFGRAVRADDLIVGLSPSSATSLHPGLGSVAGPSGETSARLPGNSVIVEWLPPYAPDLNPEEYCHGNVKQRLKNWTPEHVAEIRRGIDNGFARLRRRRDLLLSFFRHAGLSVNQLW
jgi:transposase